MVERIGRGLAALMLAGLLATPAMAQEATPQQAADVHLGVASCAGSTCHGAVEPWRDSTVLQNEYTTWQSKDSHAKAYQTLLSAESKRIAKNLGLPNAHEAKVCLDCHADNVPVAQRGPQFQISDGVGCEACHGGGERWLGIHVSGRATHAQNVAAGMFPTEEPVKRAEMCMNCHFGDETRFVTHRIMGAGHPRMSFELDTFTAIQPAHYRIDDDYRKRKTVANGVKTWAIGQAIAYTRLMEAVADPKRNHDGIFPEFVLYDCQACHTPTSNVAWAPRESEGIGPGVIRIHDGNTMMLRVLARHVNPALEKELVEKTRAVHAASVKDRGQMEEAAKVAAQVGDKMAAAFAAREFDQGDVRAMLTGVVAAGIDGGYLDYASAEQATMALGAILDTMRKSDMVDAAQHRTMTAALEACYSAVAKDGEYKPQTFAQALQTFRASIPAL
jgi:hypothetical protein